MITLRSKEIIGLLTYETALVTNINVSINLDNNGGYQFITKVLTELNKRNLMDNKVVLIYKTLEDDVRFVSYLDGTLIFGSNIYLLSDINKPENAYKVHALNCFNKSDLITIINSKNHGN